MPENLCDLPENCSINVSNNNLCVEFYYECINQWEPQNCLSIAVEGDVNDDGVVNLIDILIVVNMILNLSEYDPYADVNGDLAITIVDIISLISIILGT